MSDTNMLAKLRAAADQIRSADDNLLRAIAAIAAHARVQIIPNDSLFGVEARPVIVLPVRMYDRMLEIIPNDGGRDE
ncbi:hypothetical protein SAMN04489859_102056 [Paracoccus alcaliphilus]|uniref:Uncharacterized protein n=1 Tax=Paracoccus alcaliphilus TaxID=34002 RepID=A0A1H8K4H9_9RHOB|nr:hypothetical protein [Paracoccus alcaliphilus]WCR17551.1 hypothetical protein JHW40_14620 [Paracoccus alcaliphilus]SEN87910.1 hypothetical protein SAMN04489859_102056 [Paracoccus alcaliphilus]